MEHKVYIAHCKEDEKTAGKIYTALEKAEIQCWMAGRDMEEGQEKPVAVAEAIANSEVVVLIFSESANRSKEIANELILTMDSGSIIIPLKIDEEEPKGALQYYLSGTHWLEASNPPNKEQLKTLTETVKTMLGLKETAAAEGAAEKIEPEKLSFFKDRERVAYTTTALIAVALVATGIFVITGSFLELARSLQALIGTF